ncbi:MAG TPA: protein phosphatase 2C domain-containing protein [Anaerolineae bacterium]|nr:protein phosphatase 2C domain-containing protein [Anaerolineae bacterium]HQK13704.1 protein phosphatase 2C domain-containing protein [Anaerolineae bacterium]
MLVLPIRWPENPGTLIAGLGVIAALLLIVVLLVLFYRRRRVEKPVAISISTSTAPVLPVLPEETLLNNGRYRILKIHATSETANEYVVCGTTPISRCSHCGAPIESDEMRNCARCGADLSDVTLVYPRFRVREMVDARAWNESNQLMAMRLSHPALLLPLDTFMETTSGTPRYYCVEPFVSHTAGRGPLSPDKLLQQGIMLAQGLAYLHQRGVVLRHVDEAHIVSDNKNISFVCVDNVIPLAGDENAFTGNVQALAQVMLNWLQGTSTAFQDVPPLADVAASLAGVRETAVDAETLATSLEQALYRLRAQQNVRLQVGCLSDVGRARVLNEDSVLALDCTDRLPAFGAPVGVFAVADGIGGQAAGDVASHLIINVLIEEAQKLDILTDKSILFPARVWLEQALLAVNQAVYTQRKAASNDMGSTLVLALATGAYMTIANMGDSRAYWLAADGAMQITTDHSLVERLVAIGHITAQEARVHPRRNVIYRAVGDKPRPEFDLFEQVLAPGEALLLCSDGLSGMLTDAQIWQIWRESPSPQVACERLVEAANVAGGTDNISVVVVQLAAGNVTEEHDHVREKIYPS